MPNDNTPETPLLKRLNEQRVAAARMAREFADRAAEGTELSAEDNKAYERANADIDKYGRMVQDEIKRIQEDRSVEDAYNEGLRKLRGAPGSKESRGAQNGKSLAETMREDLRASRRGESRNGGMYQSIPEHRDLVVGTSTKGQELVPTTLVENLYQKLFDDSTVLQAGVTMLRTESGEPMKLPRLTALGALNNTTAYTAPPGTNLAPRIPEAGQIAENDPSFDQVSLDAYKYAQFTQVSRELVEDGVLDIEALIGQVLGRNVANYIGYDLVLGTGTSQPRGVRTIVTAGSQKVTGDTGVTGFVTAANGFDKFFDVVAMLKPGYRRNAKWLVNDASMFQLRKLKMNGVYAWEPNLQGAGQPDRFLGYPVMADPNIPAFGLTGGVTAIFGDFSAYFVRMVRDVRIEWSMEYAWVNDLLSVKAVVRADGDAIDDAAFAGFVSAAS